MRVSHFRFELSVKLFYLPKYTENNRDPMYLVFTSIRSVILLTACEIDIQYLMLLYNMLYFPQLCAVLIVLQCFKRTFHYHIKIHITKSECALENHRKYLIRWDYFSNHNSFAIHNVEAFHSYFGLNCFIQVHQQYVSSTLKLTNH